MSNAEVCDLVNGGNIMKAPANCPEDWYVGAFNQLDSLFNREGSS
jgi:hypothetical protein